MNETQDDRLRRLLQEAAPPLAASRLERDLWPRMLNKLAAHTMSVSGLDWALAALLLVLVLAFPQVIPTLLYHL